jgi:hypothetical protein
MGVATMQFNSKITIVSNTYNEFGEVQAGSGTEIKCAVLDYSKTRRTEEKASNKHYDLIVMVPYKAFSPYTDIVTDNAITVTYDGKRYEPMKISTIKSSSGKTKFVEIAMREFKDGN